MQLFKKDETGIRPIFLILAWVAAVVAPYILYAIFILKGRL